MEEHLRSVGTITRNLTEYFQKIKRLGHKLENLQNALEKQEGKILSKTTETTPKQRCDETEDGQYNFVFGVARDTVVIVLLLVSVTLNIVELNKNRRTSQEGHSGGRLTSPGENSTQNVGKDLALEPSTQTPDCFSNISSSTWSNLSYDKIPSIFTLTTLRNRRSPQNEDEDEISLQHQYETVESDNAEGHLYPGFQIENENETPPGQAHDVPDKWMNTPGPKLTQAEFQRGPRLQLIPAEFRSFLMGSLQKQIVRRQQIWSAPKARKK